MKSGSVNQSFSIIVAAKNEYENLQKLIPELLNQQAELDFEIIIVNDCSQDQTMELLEKYALSDHKLKCLNINKVPEGKNSKKYALEQGISLASYDNLIFTDADCIPNSNNWASTMSSYLTRDKGIVLGLSYYNYHKGFLNLIIRYETLQTIINYLGYATSGLAYMGVGRNLVYKKTLFLENEGFKGIDKILGGDDDLLVQKISSGKNTAVCINKETICYSKPKRNVRDYIIQKKRHLSVGKYYRTKFKFLLTLDLTSNLFFYCLFLFFIIIDNLSMQVTVMLLSKLLITSIFTYQISRKAHARISVLEIVFMDFFNSLITVSLGIYSLLVRNKRWN